MTDDSRVEAAYQAASNEMLDQRLVRGDCGVLDLKAMIRAALAAADKAAWRPISEAPKDGTAVLLYGPRYDTPDGTPGIAVGRWYEDGLPPRTWWGTSANGLIVQAPTHFMPPPAPPSDD